VNTSSTNADYPPNRPRILHIGPLPPPVGGMQLNVQRFLRSPVARTFAITNINPDVLGKLRFSGWARLVLNILNCIVLVAQLVCKLISARPALVHIRTSSFAGFYEKSILSMIARLAGQPVIMHIHGGGFNDFYRNSGWIGKHLIRYCLDLNDTIVVLSDHMYQLFRRLGVEDKKLVIVENSVYMPSRTVWDQTKTLRQADRNTKTRVLFLNRIAEEKGVRELLEAAKQLACRHPNVTFCLAGPETELLRSVREQIYHDGLEERFETPGEVSGARKERMFLDSDIYVLPSYVEGMPIGLLEAMSYGLPSVATTVGGIPSMIEDEENGLLIPPRNVSALVEALERLLGDYELRYRLGLAGYKTVQSRFNWDIAAQRLINLYNSVLQKR
jgi:glycosyltransferase involved in cell wall biosynthesis